MVELKTLNPANFKDFLSLIKERGEAPEAYYRWKFLNQVYNTFPTGLIAYINGEAVGCIGSINRVYVDAAGGEHAAIWLCDACISNAVKEKGIGVSLSVFVSLFTYFSALSAFRFCIPGNAPAKAIMKKSGFSSQKDCYEISIPCLPFKFGFNQYKGNTIERISRGIKHILLKPASTHFKQAAVTEIGNDFIFEFEPGINRLKRDPAYFKWLYSMPGTADNPKQWYKINAAAGWVIVMADKDYRNLSRARVIDFKLELHTDKLIIDFFLNIRPVLANLGIVFFETCLHIRISPALPKSYFKVLPKYASFLYADNFHFSIIDKESSWINLKFK